MTTTNSTDTRYQRAEDLFKAWQKGGLPAVNRLNPSNSDTSLLFEYLGHVNSEWVEATKKLSEQNKVVPMAKSGMKHLDIAKAMPEADARLKDLETQVEELKLALRKKGTQGALQRAYAELEELTGKYENLLEKWNLHLDQQGTPTTYVPQAEIQELKTQLAEREAELELARQEAAEAKAHMASQNEHMMAMERQIIDTSNVEKPEPSEIDQLASTIETMLRKDAKVKVTVEAVVEEHLEYVFGG